MRTGAVMEPNDEPRYTSPDMFEAWEAGYRWCAQAAEIVDGELWLPDDEPGVEGLDHGEACGFWLQEYDTELQANAVESVALEGCTPVTATGADRGHQRGGLDRYIDLVIACRELKPYLEYESHDEWIAAIREVRDLANHFTGSDDDTTYQRGYNAGYAEANRDWQTSR